MAENLENEVEGREEELNEEQEAPIVSVPAIVYP